MNVPSCLTPECHWLVGDEVRNRRQAVHVERIPSYQARWRSKSRPGGRSKRGGDLPTHYPPAAAV